VIRCPASRKEFVHSLDKVLDSCAFKVLEWFNVGLVYSTNQYQNSPGVFREAPIGIVFKLFCSMIESHFARVH